MNFTIDEFLASSTAKAMNIDNTPPEHIKAQLLFTMAGMERIRAYLGGFPIKIDSGYRCDALNKAVGGSTNSQHMRGEAADFVCPLFGSPKQIADKLVGAVQHLGIDQMILEGTWVHVSFTLNPRHEVLTFKAGGYVRGLV